MRTMRNSLWRKFLMASVSLGTAAAAEDAAMLKQYCFGCHSKAAAGGINLEQLIAQQSVSENFHQWERVARVLEQKSMPPAKMKQPADEDRQKTAQWIHTRLNDYAQKNDGDPGKVTVRRLTSGEYGYTINDLTGLDLKFDRDFASDSVGGEGFTNFGDVQFMGDANLERYLEAAKLVAARAVIGAGPLSFYDDPGKSGFELSAIHRIQDIYRTNGFRANSGEGGKPYGLDKYAKAFFVCWQYQHRKALGESKATLDTIAARDHVSPRFAHHLWTILHEPKPTYPTTVVIARYKKLPVPTAATKAAVFATARKESNEVEKALIDWPRWLFAAGAEAADGQGDERALVFNDENLKAEQSHKFKAAMPRVRGGSTARVFLSSAIVNPGAESKAVIVWRNATVRIRRKDRGLAQTQPLMAVLDEATIKRLNFGQRPDGGAIGEKEFAMAGDSQLGFEIPLPADSIGVALEMDATLGEGANGNAVLRCVLADAEDFMKGRPFSAILGDAQSAAYKTWKAGVMQFASELPQNSQGEPAPADKDPIPLPFNNAYNQPERDHFHAKLKYFRDDRFIYQNILDDASRKRLDEAWLDLLDSFDYHDYFLKFISDKYKLGLKKNMASLTPADIEAMPAEPRPYVKALKAEYDHVEQAQLSAHPGHINDCLEFAAQAWRRPLTSAERDQLRAFYTKATETLKLDHQKAVRLLLTRILVAPPFLYRIEQPAPAAAMQPLSSWEVANRLSYFLWSSVPDAELRRAAAANELTDATQVQRQVKRMLADAKARRLSTEFFGQWLGFYRFDQYRGVDTTRFPEFTDEVRNSMYDEAVSFFEHIVREDRPVRELFAADYTFLNKPLAKHYGIKREIAATGPVALVNNTGSDHRGGMLRLGAVLTVTSAPLRTSPVKRGDWVLRRILGTPTPPPPADAGSIPADPKLFAGQTVRQRLDEHKRNATCASCHTRIDPLGFPLERYDSMGRWRDTYSDGKAVEDTSKLRDDTAINGIDGLLAYLKTQEKPVMHTLSGKLVGYALGRTVMLSDQPLIDRMTSSGMDANFSKLVTEIAMSKQFRYRRERDDAPAPNTPKPQTAGDPAVLPATIASKESKGGL